MSAVFSDVLNAVEGKFDARMLVTIFFPCLVFVMILGGLIIAAFVPAPTGLMTAWNGYPVEFQAFAIILALCLVLLIALVMSSLMTPVIRLYEGYWEGLPLINIVGEARRQHYKAILDGKYKRINDLSKTVWGLSEKEKAGRKLDDKESSSLLAGKLELMESYNEIYYRFPAPTRSDEAMPTRLGNILKSSETYPSVRYGVDSVLMWPRLFPNLPQGFADSITAARSMLDMMVTVSFLGFCLTVAAFLWGAAIIALQTSAWQIPGIALSGAFAPYLWLIFTAAFFGGLAVGYLGYRGALGSALGYSELIKTAFDLHRGLAIKALGYKQPEDLEAEYGLWNEASKFIHRNIPGEAIKAVIQPSGDSGGKKQ